MAWSRGIFMCGLLFVLLVGCGASKEKLTQVQGKVLLGDKTLGAGFVIFYPDKSKGNKSLEEPRGEIDAKGDYQLLTGMKSGAAPGWYKVAITAADQIDMNNPYFTKWLIPERYIDPKTSKLAVEVTEIPAAGAYDFKLEPK